MNSEPVLPPAIYFSDSAARDQATGKLTLGGIFHRFTTTRIPFTSPAFFATVLVTNISGRIALLPVTLNIEAPGGEVISTATGHISAPSQVARNDVVEIAFPLPPTEFKATGQYRAVVVIDGEDLGYRAFNVVLME